MADIKQITLPSGSTYDIVDQGARDLISALPSVNNGTLTMQVNGTTKQTFTANQATAATFNVTTADLGLPNIMNFVGVSTTDPKGSSGATVSGHTTWKKGDVVLYGTKEFVLTANSNVAANWTELGDEGSHALKTITITGTGVLGGGGDLTANRTITHNTSGATAGSYGDSAAQTPGYGGTFKVPYVTINNTGHVTSISDHTVTIPASDNTNQTVKGAGTAFGANDAVDIVAGNNVTVTPDTTNKKITIASTNTTYSAGSGLSLSGTTFNHSNAVTAGTAGTTTAQTPGYGSTFNIPYVTYDAQGHVTGSGNSTVKIPASDNTDTKVTQTVSTANYNYPILAKDSNATTTTTATSKFAAAVTLNPSTGNINATQLNGVTIGSSPKFTDTVTTVSTSGSGNAVTSITASSGALTVTKGSTFMTGVTLNGSSSTSPSFYAPTSAGTSGYVLTSNGSGAPTWQAASGGVKIAVQSSQPSGQSSGDFWYQVTG